MKKIEWLQSALDELSNIWVHSNSGTRKAITQACHALEKRLIRNPEDEGESRTEERRVTFERPLAVYFRCESDGITVTVLQIVKIATRK